MYPSGSTSRHPMKSLFIIALLILPLLAGCAPKAIVQQVEVTQAPTATEPPSATQTPVPTSTNTLAPSSTPTATATATATATPDKKATAMFAMTSTAEALVEKIKPDLETYGYSVEDGHLVWSSDEEYTLQTTSYGELRYHPLDDLESVSNFIVQSKVEWDTAGALAGCGFIFRSEEDIAEGKQNMFYLIRLQSAPAWALDFLQFGRFQSQLVRTVYSRNINDKNGTDNLITLVVDGRKITPYLNGEKERTVEDAKLKQGLIAMVALQDSGTTTCTFKDTWVWAIDKKK